MRAAPQFQRLAIGLVRDHLGAEPGTGALIDQRPQPLDEAPDPVDAAIRILDIALRRAVGQHEPARRIGAVSVDEIVEIDDILLRFRHFSRSRPQLPACRSRFPRSHHRAARLRSAAASARRRTCRSRASPCPCVNRPAKGSPALHIQQAAIIQRAREEARIEQVVEWHARSRRHIGRPASSVERSSRHQTVFHLTRAMRKRRKYQDEQTKVSSVSVSRRAGPPHFGQATLTASLHAGPADCPAGQR